jgi:hypothetical protein
MNTGARNTSISLPLFELESKKISQLFEPSSHRAFITQNPHPHSHWSTFHTASSDNPHPSQISQVATFDVLEVSTGAIQTRATRRARHMKDQRRDPTIVLRLIDQSALFIFS